MSKFTDDPLASKQGTLGVIRLRLASLTSESLKARAASLFAVFSILQMEMSHPLQQLLDFPDVTHPGTY